VKRIRTQQLPSNHDKGIRSTEYPVPRTKGSQARESVPSSFSLSPCHLVTGPPSGSELDHPFERFTCHSPLLKRRPWIAPDGRDPTREALIHDQTQIASCRNQTGTESLRSNQFTALPRLQNGNRDETCYHETTGISQARSESCAGKRLIRLRAASPCMRGQANVPLRTLDVRRIRRRLWGRGRHHECRAILL
jgi:hypothetical protein